MKCEEYIYVYVKGYLIKKDLIDKESLVLLACFIKISADFSS